VHAGETGDGGVGGGRCLGGVTRLHAEEQVAGGFFGLGGKFRAEASCGQRRDQHAEQGIQQRAREVRGGVNRVG
jgi:hypothetical protein